MEIIVLFLIGGILVALGICNCMGQIGSIHWYNRTKVTEEDAPKYGKCMGSGTIITGISLIVTAAVQLLFHQNVYSILLAGVAVGIALMLYGQFKYNKGIF